MNDKPKSEGTPLPEKRRIFIHMEDDQGKFSPIKPDDVNKALRAHPYRGMMFSIHEDDVKIFHEGKEYSLMLFITSTGHVGVRLGQYKGDAPSIEKKVFNVLFIGSTNPMHTGDKVILKNDPLGTPTLCVPIEVIEARDEGRELTLSE